MIRNRIEKYSLRRGNCYCKKSNSIFVNIIFQALPWHVNRSLMILKFSKIFWNRTSMLIWKINLRNVLTFHKILHRLSHFSHSRGLNQLFSEANSFQPILRNKLVRASCNGRLIKKCFTKTLGYIILMQFSLIWCFCLAPAFKRRNENAI